MRVSLPETSLEIWREQLVRLQSGLNVLDDKPEETADSCLRALWLKAAGISISAQRAKKTELPALNNDGAKCLVELVNKRLEGTPLSYITSRQSFMKLEFITTPGAMIPRKETEILGNAVLQLIDEVAKTDKTVHIIDVCTGSGNLPVVFGRHNPDAQVFAADLSAEAVALAKKNVMQHDLDKTVEIRQGDLLAPFESDEFYGNIDILTCNPPYISNAKVDDLPEEIIGYEPQMAFVGGSFGIDIPNRLVNEAPRFLNKENGWLAFEIGLGQGSFFIKRMRKNGNFRHIEGAEDEDGNIRAVLARI